VTDSLNTVFFIGRPGCGKGTQTQLLAARTGWKTFSTGNRFKQLRDEDSALGARIRADFDKGLLSPDWFAEFLFSEAMLGVEEGAGIICEGFPRSLPQAEFAEKVLSWLERPYKVIHLVVTDEEAIRRQMSRAQTEHRPDSDDEEKIRARLETYRAQTEPALAHFKTQGTLIELDGSQSREDIAAAVASALHLA
jgi:adenylate kinase